MLLGVALVVTSMAALCGGMVFWESCRSLRRRRELPA